MNKVNIKNTLVLKDFVHRLKGNIMLVSSRLSYIFGGILKQHNSLLKCNSGMHILSNIQLIKRMVVNNNIQKNIHTTSTKCHEHIEGPETINVTFITKEGQKLSVVGKSGERALYLAHRKGIDMEGACEASLACTTCHVYVESEEEHWDQLPEATETEEDLLDMAPFLAPNSRLGCQIILSPDIDGIVLRLPRATKNFYVDGHKPQPH